MKRFLRFAIAALAVLTLCEVYFLWYATEPSYAQSAFLGRPYYGSSVLHTARFDHQYPVYGSEAAINPGVTTTLMREDGAVYSNATLALCGSNPTNACYSGHDGRDFPIFYKPVVSAAQGIVQFAGWYSTDHAAGLGLYIEVEHNSGAHRTVYGHLSAVRYQPTTSVGRWQIGTSGTTGNSTGVHLHFGVKVNMSGTFRVTDPYGWTGGTDPWQQWSGVPSYFLWLPEPDRTLPAPPRGQEIWIDDGDTGTTYQCVSGYYWWTASTGAAVNSDLHYTYANGTNYNCLATWGGYAHGSPVSLPSSGLYEVEVHVPAWDTSNSTRAARYTVFFPGGTNIVVVDQSRIASSQWISVGRYTFNSGSQLSQYIYVMDNSKIGSFIDLTSRKVLVDAVRLVKSH